jgi:hypothetical protein
LFGGHGESLTAKGQRDEGEKLREKNIEHSTFNIEHPMKLPSGAHFDVGS